MHGDVDVDVAVSGVHVRGDDDCPASLLCRNPRDVGGKFIIAVELSHERRKDVILQREPDHPVAKALEQRQA